MEGDKVKVTVMFRGREMVHTARGRTQLTEVTKQLGPIAKMENAPRMEGRFMSMILVGDREVIADLKRKEEAERAANQANDETPVEAASAPENSEENAEQGTEAQAATEDSPAVEENTAQ